MKEFDKQTWLEELADKYEVPVEQVVIAWAVYQISCNLFGNMNCKVEFSEVVLPQLF